MRVYLNAVVEEGLSIDLPDGAAHLSWMIPKGGCEISGSLIPEGVRSFLPSRSPPSFQIFVSFPFHPDLV